jgi:hypothetical protein
VAVVVQDKQTTGLDYRPGDAAWTPGVEAYFFKNRFRTYRSIKAE